MGFMVKIELKLFLIVRSIAPKKMTVKQPQVESSNASTPPRGSQARIAGPTEKRHTPSSRNSSYGQKEW